MKKIILMLVPMLFMTTSIFAQWDIEEGFEGETFPPTDWTVINNNGGSEWLQMTSATYAHTGEKLTYCMRESSSGNPNDDWLITPQVSVQSGDSLIFWARGWSGLYDESFNVKLSTTGNAVADFTVTLGTGTISSNVYAEFEYDLSSYNGQDVYLAIQYVSVFEFALLVDDVSVGQDEPAIINVNLKVFLEGPFNETDMNTNLNPDDIPLSQPYNIAPWNYAGTESVVSIPNANVVDWVLVELRDTTEAQYAIGSTIIARQAAFILNDGSIVGMDGSSILSFNSSIIHQLFAVIWHRNHLGILSANALSGLGNVYIYDFTTGADKAYGINAQKYLSIGIYGMISGDVDASGFIDQDDKSIYWEPSAGTTGYKNSDLNLNTEVDNIDKDDFWVPNLGSESHVPE